MSDTKRRDYNTKKSVLDGRQRKDMLGTVRVELGKSHMDYGDCDFGSVDNPKERQYLKKQARRAIRRDGKNIINNSDGNSAIK